MLKLHAIGDDSPDTEEQVREFLEKHPTAGSVTLEMGKEYNIVLKGNHLLMLLNSMKDRNDSLNRAISAYDKVLPIAEGISEEKAKEVREAFEEHFGGNREEVGALQEAYAEVAKVLIRAIDPATFDAHEAMVHAIGEAAERSAVLGGTGTKQ